MIFEKSSTRTRVSFETGMLQLGGHALNLNTQDLQLGRGEPVSDTAKALSRYVDAIMIRTFGHDRIEELAEHASIPVINGLTETFHPCQALADLKTIYRLKEKFVGIKTAYLGDGNNVAHSLMIGAAKVGMDFTIATPKGYEPNQTVVEKAQEIAAETGAKIIVTTDPVEAVKNADIIYTDVWASMGQESEQQERLVAFKDFQVNDELAKHAKDDYHFLHCLPAHREEEVTASIIDGDHSAVWEQAENRLHVQKALLVKLLA
jgi:ornithine carbamoyltransferase